MFRNLMSRLFDQESPSSQLQGTDAEVAIAALLVRVARADDHYTAQEEARIDQILARRRGLDLNEAWRDGAEAHLGMSVAGFPNLFLLYGPNTNLGHNSIVFMLERQISYILTTVRRMVEDGIGSVEVRSDVQEASNDRLQRRLRRTVWADSCHSWYKTAAGRITNNWSGLTLDYWRRTARPRWQDFRLEPRSTTAEAHSGAERVRH